MQVKIDDKTGKDRVLLTKAQKQTLHQAAILLKIMAKHGSKAAESAAPGMESVLKEIEDGPAKED